MDELVRVLTERIGLSHRLASLARRRILKRSMVVKSKSSVAVPQDPNDSPILQAALTCSADYLVSNDRHLLELDPFHGVRIISMNSYLQLLRNEGLVK
jgi:predicted nucleic acid-binding protein